MKATEMRSLAPRTLPVKRDVVKAAVDALMKSRRGESEVMWEVYHPCWKDRASGALALAGLSEVIVGDMQLRNIGIVGYAGVFPIAEILIDPLPKRQHALDDSN